MMNIAMLCVLLHAMVVCVYGQTVRTEYMPATATVRLNTLPNENAVVKTIPKKKQRTKKTQAHRINTQDSLRRAQQIERINAESWQTFRQYAKDKLDTTALYPVRHPFAEPQVRQSLLAEIIAWLGTRYGTAIANEPRRLDCSLFTAMMMRKVLGIQLLHGSPSIAGQVKKLRSLQSIAFGDLVFFTGSNAKSKKVGHVGMYIANGVFAHASIQKGVIFSHWREPYYAQRFLFAGTIRTP